MLRSESGDAERLEVLVVGGRGLDLFWLEMVFKGSRLPYCIEAVPDENAAAELLAHRATPDLMFVVGADRAAQLPFPLFVLGDAKDREKARGAHFVERPLTHEKLFECLAKADLGAWSARVVPV